MFDNTAGYKLTAGTLTSGTVKAEAEAARAATRNSFMIVYWLNSSNKLNYDSMRWHAKNHQDFLLSKSDTSHTQGLLIILSLFPTKFGILCMYSLILMLPLLQYISRRIISQVEDPRKYLWHHFLILMHATC